MSAAAKGGRVICIGGAVTDVTYRAAQSLQDGTSNPVHRQVGFGGVARNVAENLARLGIPVTLCSIVGDDPTGLALRSHAESAGIDTSRLTVTTGLATASYVAILEPDGRLKLGLADMALFDRMTPAWLDEIWPTITNHIGAGTSNQGWIFADCNLPAPTLASLIYRCRENARNLVIDGVSIAKSQRLPAELAGVAILFVNADEAAALATSLSSPEASAQALLERGAGVAVVTAGANGLVYATPNEIRALSAVPTQIVDVTGAGDSLIAGTLAARLQGVELAAALVTGTRLAAMTIASATSVSSALSPTLLKQFR